MNRNFLIPMDRLPEVFRQSQNLQDALTSYRALIGQPKASGTLCDEYARGVLGTIPKVSPAPKTPKKDPPEPKVSKILQPKVEAPNAISLGRQEVLRGLRPKLVDAVIEVMGQDSLSGPEVLYRLQQKGWAPVAAQPTSYISYVLSDNRNTFKRVARGHYKVRHPKATSAPKSASFKPLRLSKLEEVLKDTSKFPSNAAILQIVPFSIRKKLSPKSSRERLVKTLMNVLKNCTPVGEEAFQRAVVARIS